MASDSYMADDSTPDPSTLPVPVPVSLDRAALERVLARAAELQAHTAEPAEGMNEAQLEALGAEVGISKEHIRQAVAEERTRVAVPEEGGFVGTWFGPSFVTASRVVRGKPEQILAMLDQWMQTEEGLRPRRRFADRLTWEARRDFISSLQTGFNIKGRAYSLTAAAEVAASAVAVDNERVIVRLDADVSVSRRRVATWTGIGTGGMWTTAAGLVGVAASIPGASLLVAGVVATVWSLAGVALGVGLASSQRKRTSRSQLALEQILDRLERGEIQQPRGGATALLDLLVPTRR
ncbi:MAG: hypothetical protein U0132_23345 [Gemmatimonadaceae bacterium]